MSWIGALTANNTLKKLLGYYLVSSAIFAAIGLLFFEFVPSDSFAAWFELIFWVLIIVFVPVGLYFHILSKSIPYNLSTTPRWLLPVFRLPYLIPAMMASIMAFFTYLLVTLSIPYTITAIAGTKGQQELVIEHRSIQRACSSHLTYAGKPTFSGSCVSPMLFNRVQEGDRVRIGGLQTKMGMIVDSIAVVDR